MDEKKVRDLTRSAADDYYVKAFKEIASGKKFVWNWGACGLFHWMIYRKMFTPAFLIFALVSYLLFAIHNVFIFLGICIVLAALCGAFGNLLYYNYSERYIKKGVATLEDYNPLCYLGLFTSIFVLYPSLLSFLAFLGNYQKWVAENAEFFGDSEKKLMDMYAAINPTDYEHMAGATISIILVAVLQFVIVSGFFYGRDWWKLRKSEKKLTKMNTQMSEANIRIVTSTGADEYYFHQFERIEKGAIFSINCAAAFFGGRIGILWFAYRKMYKTAAVMLIFGVAYFRGLHYAQSEDIRLILNLVMLAVELILLLGGANHIYYRYVKCVIENKVKE